MRSKKTRAMVATWSDKESDSSTESEEEERDNLYLMTNGKEIEKVSFEKEDFFSNDQWELAYSTLFEKYKRRKHDNKNLKRKIEFYVHDSSPCFECVAFKEEIEKLNDQLASFSGLNNSTKNIENLIKNNALLVAELAELKSLVGQISEE